ncbi:glycine zipper 2TM domain-containing protein [Chryseobacterium sp. SNU WT5]|uniref:YMGG-like glycine zipper-containing protein n=1 Tax=Chryseobacterium sp. SNU WT5 TaxID=2594269 RepID=UPI00117FB69D|nr:YMGG-like glycine zipper-containing protein [Chryseobacterium sp. SNU WT5]QDP85779.1 glycine zipper 2TM domain-containing protein [Chryseobacterium sp. SNU WT5]
MKSFNDFPQKNNTSSVFKNIFLTGAFSVVMLTACSKEKDTVSEKSLDQQKIEFQTRQLEIEKQKLAIEKEKMAYETQKKADSIAQIQQAKASAKPQVIRETKTVYVNNSPRRASSSGNSNAGSSQGSNQTVAQKKGMSKAAKGTIIGTVGGAAAGAIISKKNRGLGAVIGGIAGGATGYTIGRAQDRKDGRVKPRN